MKIRIIVAVLVFFTGITLSFIASSSALDNIIESSPSKAVISVNNSCLLSEHVDSKFGKDYSIKLPADTDIKSIKIFSGGNTIKNKKIEKISHTETIEQKIDQKGNVVCNKQEKEAIDYYLVTLEPKSELSSDFILEYLVTGINWTPRLTSNIEDGFVDLSFDAIISNTSVDLKNTDIVLVSMPRGQYSDKTINTNTNDRNDRYSPITPKPLSKTDQVFYTIGKLSLPKTTTSKILTNIATSNHNILKNTYVWQTDDEFVRNILVTTNPFPFVICNTTNIIYYHSAVIDETNSNWSNPKDKLYLYEDNEKTILCNSSVEVVEDLVKKKRYQSQRDYLPTDVLYYNHSYDFNCTNESGAEKEIDIVFKKKYGKNSKTIYHFEKEPTESPSWWHIWRVKLGKNLSYLLKFNIDSDVDTFKEYKKYKKALEGC